MNGMNRFGFLAGMVALFLLGTSCRKDQVPTPDSDLGEFELIAGFIDLSQQNKYNESLFCNDWILSKVSREHYVDGVLQDTEDATSWWSKMQYTIRNDHTIRYGGVDGVWRYSHNTLMWRIEGYYSYEVVGAEEGILKLKKEDYPLGIPFTPFFKDNRGEHYFYVFEYIPLL
jgi:hypothetical protein